MLLYVLKLHFNCETLFVEKAKQDSESISSLDDHDNAVGSSYSKVMIGIQHRHVNINTMHHELLLLECIILIVLFMFVYFLLLLISF